MRSVSVGDIVSFPGVQGRFRVSAGECPNRSGGTQVCCFLGAPKCNGAVFREFGRCHGYHFVRLSAERKRKVSYG